MQRSCLVHAGQCWPAAPSAAPRHPRSHKLAPSSLRDGPLLRCPCRPSWQQYPHTVHRRHDRLVVRSTQGAGMIQEANQKYTSKDLMAALKLYEEVLEQPDLPARQRQAALYGAIAVHAAFGDVELAQMTLRDGIQQGLDFEQALQDPDLPDLQASPQILIQLKRFNSSAQAALTKTRSRPKGSGRSSSYSSSMKVQSPMDRDLGDFLGTPTSDQAAVDTSVGGIIKRVVLLLLALSALGTLLFFVGLEYMFPKY